MSEDKELQYEVVHLLEELKKTEPIDTKGNPFVLLPSKDLLELKKTIEEFSEELAPILDDLKR